MKLEGIMLSELSQRKTNTIGLKYKEFQKKQKMELRVEKWLPNTGG